MSSVEGANEVDDGDRTASKLGSVLTLSIGFFSSSCSDGKGRLYTIGRDIERVNNRKGLTYKSYSLIWSPLVVTEKKARTPQH